MVENADALDDLKKDEFEPDADIQGLAYQLDYPDDEEDDL